MTNPFDDAEGVLLVIVNEEGQHSLWPAGTAVPAGWSAAHGPADRESCLSHVRTQWTDLRPRSLAAAMDQNRRTE
jgi:MbtH protein